MCIYIAGLNRVPYEKDLVQVCDVQDLTRTPFFVFAEIGRLNDYSE